MKSELNSLLKKPHIMMDLLSEADIVTLTLVLSHLTSDSKYIELIKPYVKGAFDYAAKVPEDISLQIRNKLIEVLLQKNGQKTTLSNIENINDKFIQKIMSVGVGEDVPSDYVPMMKEELSFDAENIRDFNVEYIKEYKNNNFNCVIIGAGLCGILAGIKFLQAGIPFIIIEKNDSIGGTWYENSYPGCGVDTPNHVYAYSFEPSFKWDEFYSKRDAIYKYLKSCVEKYDLSKYIRLNTTVEKCIYDEKNNRWETTIINNGNKEKLQSSIIISAVGQLNRPSLPDIHGINDFKKPIIHTGAWDHKYNFNNKNVSLIGTGASSMQVAPELAKVAKKLTVFQRTPHWVIANPNYHRKLSKGKKWVLENIPYYSRWYRFQLFWGFCDGIHASLCKDPSWNFPDRSINHTNDRFRINMIKHMEAIIGNDKELLQKVIPDYPPYGKRMLMDNNWFKMLKRKNVELISGSINSITENSIIDKNNNHYKTDVIVTATGFNASKMLWPMDIIGKNQINLSNYWKDDNPRAHLGITVPSFPNFFIMYGPNTNLAHGGSIVFHGECQIRYILGCIKLLLSKNVSAMDCRKNVFENYNEDLDEQHGKMVWTHSKVSSWYRNDSGRVITNSPWRLVDYWNMTKEPKENDFIFN